MSLTLEEIDFRSRVFVCGMREIQVPSDHDMHGKKIINTGSFSAHFEAHPWVQRSIAEGFASVLRQHCIAQVKAHMGRGIDHTNVGSMMPEKSLIEHWSKQAKRFALAADWRKSVSDQYGSVDAYLGRGKRLDRNWSAARVVRNQAGANS